MPNRTMMLPCDLTDADRLRIGEVLTTEIKAREQIEAAKKAAVKDFNVALKQHKAKEHDFNESLFTGKELREVEVEERPDYVAGIVFVHRLDSGDCIQQRAIDPDERQVKLGIDGPTVLDGGKVDAADEQRDASTPEEAEALRAERLAGERAERISAGVQEARGRIALTFDEACSLDSQHLATLQLGNRVIEAAAATPEAAADGVARQVTEILEAEEDEAAARQPTWEEVVAASKAEQDRQELESLAKAQAEDDKATKKRTLKVGAGDGLKNGGLKAPRKKKGLTVALPDGRTVDPEQEAAANEGEPPTPGDDGPVAVPSDDETPEGCAF